jgi:multisubunit Na+/H+ antiporter MnhC subunit
VGVWLWYREHASIVRWLITLVAVMAVYFTHLIAFAICGFIVGVYALVVRRTWRQVIASAALFLPGILLFFYVKTGLTTNHSVYLRDWRDKLQMIVDIPFHSYSGVTDKITIFAIAACIIIAIVRNRGLRIHLPWLAVFAAVFLMYLMLPYAWGETFDIDLRLLPAAFVLLLLIADVGRRRARMLVAIAVALVALKLYIVTTGMQQRSQMLQGARAAIEKIDRNSRVLPLVQAPDDQDVLDREFVHYADYAVIRRGAFVPYLFDIPGQMPLRCDPCIDAPDDFWDLEYDNPPDWQPISRNYDYLWAWDVAKFDATIQGFADPVFASGKLSLYHVRR